MLKDNCLFLFPVFMLKISQPAPGYYKYMKVNQSPLMVDKKENRHVLKEHLVNLLIFPGALIFDHSACFRYFSVTFSKFNQE